MEVAQTRREEVTRTAFLSGTANEEALAGSEILPSIRRLFYAEIDNTYHHILFEQSSMSFYYYYYYSIDRGLLTTIDEERRY